MRSLDHWTVHTVIDQGWHYRLPEQFQDSPPRAIGIRSPRPSSSRGGELSTRPWCLGKSPAAGRALFTGARPSMALPSLSRRVPVKS